MNDTELKIFTYLLAQRVKHVNASTQDLWNYYDDALVELAKLYELHKETMITIIRAVKWHYILKYD